MTADCLVQGLVQAQECMVHGRGVCRGVGSTEGDCIQFGGVTGQCGEREVCVVQDAGAGGFLCRHGSQCGGLWQWQWHWQHEGQQCMA